MNTTLFSTSAMGKGAALDNMINNLEATLGAGLNMSDSESSIDSTTYNNATMTAYNGDISISSIGILDGDGKNISASGDNENTGNTTISGANILADNLTINTSNNLNVESKQNSYVSSSKSSGFSIGASQGKGKSGVGSISGGINQSSSDVDRLWVDNQTTLIGTSSITINTGNNTDIIGALIGNITNADVTSNKEEWVDGGNLTLNTNTLTYKDLNDYDYSESTGFSFSTTIGAGLDGTSNNPIQNLNFYPEGSTRIVLNNQSSEKEQLTKATIGNGSINLNSDITFNAIDGSTSSITNQVESSDSAQLVNLNRDITNSQEITKDLITGALDVDVTIDNRIFAAAFELASGAELTEEERADGKKLNWEILLDEQKGVVGNTIFSSKMLVVEAKDIVNSGVNMLIKAIKVIDKLSETARVMLFSNAAANQEVAKIAIAGYKLSDKQKKDARTLIKNVNDKRGIDLENMSIAEKAKILAKIHSDGKRNKYGELTSKEKDVVKAIYLSTGMDPKYQKHQDKFVKAFAKEFSKNPKLINDLKQWDKKTNKEKIVIA